MKKFYGIILFLILIILNGCNKDPEQSIPGEFTPYVESFFSEARARGLDMHLSDYDLEIVKTEIESGKAGHSYSWKGLIEIDRNYWNSYNEEEREWLIYHELGHCILKREHKDVNVNGNCLSYMYSGPGSYDCWFNKYSDLWRTYYLDELFGLSYELPSWYLDHQDYPFFSNNLDTILYESLHSTVFSIDSIDFSSTTSFVVEGSFKDWSPQR